jgi:tetrahydromethanopterin S-methyltransferase subunit G
MENQSTSKNLILKFGLIFAGIIIFTNLLIYALGMTYDTTGGLIVLAAVAVSLIGIPIVGIGAYKKANNGYLTWGEGVKAGIAMVLIGTVISIAYTILFTEVIEPTYFETANEMARNQLVEAGLSDEQIDAQMEMQQKFQGTPIGHALGLLFYTFVGFVVAAITAAVKKKTEEDEY